MSHFYKPWKMITRMALMCFWGFNQTFAQTSTIATGYVANNGSGLVTFNLENTNPYPIEITELTCPIGAASTVEAVFWMRPTPVSATNPPGLIAASNGWTLLDSLVSTPTFTNNTTPVVTFSKASSGIIIPANTIVGCAYGVWGSPGRTPGRQRYMDLTGAPTFSSGGVNMILGSNISMGYTSTTVTAPINNRAFCGTIQFKPHVKPGNNASVSALVAPTYLCTANEDVKVRVKNMGGNVINNVTIQWTLDNVLQPSVNLNSPLDTFGGTQYPNDTVINLGNVSFSSPRTLKVWTEYPNSVADTVNADDTLSTIIRQGLNGTYTIGGPAPDYNTLTDALTALNQAGVCGPVVLNVHPTAPASNLTATVNIGNIQGSSAINTITLNGNGHTISSSATPILDFIGTRYFTLDSFNITGNAPSYVGMGIHVGTGAHHLTFNRNAVTVSTTATGTASNCPFSSSGTNASSTTDGNNAQYLTITNNIFTGGYYSMTLIGQATYLNNYGHYIANNTFRDFYIYGAYFNDADSVVFTGNDINRATRATVSTLYGIYLGQCRYMKVQKNKVHDCGTSGSSYYPIYITNSVNGAGYETEISNNLIYNNPTTAIFYGIYSLTTAITNVNIYHNTIQHHVASGTSAIRGAFFNVTATNVNFKNNIISITGAGTGIKTGIYVTTASTSFYSNNNVIYVNTTATNNIGYWGAVQATLANWRTASGQDLNSVDDNPVFANLSTGNLKPTALATDNIGAPLGFTHDFLGLKRSATRPDAGGLEAYPPSTDNGSVSEIVLPSPLCAGLQDIKVRVANAGQNVINSISINWSVNGTPQVPLIWTSPIDTFGSAAGNDTLVTIGQYLFSNNAANIVAYTTLPNGQTDTFTVNDSSTVVGKAGLAGTYTIGAGGSYTTLTSAFADLSTRVCGPVVFELQNNYVSSGETFPLVIPAAATVTDSIVIRPALGSFGLVISGNHATNLLDLNGADYVTIDGRPGGIGTTSELSIVNTSATGSVVRFINAATNNTLKYVTIRSSNTSATSGAVFFSNVTSGSTGNSNNMISDCNIDGNSATVNCIYSAGSAAPADNQNITINNCNIYDFFSNTASTDVSGITLVAGNANWNINGNRFYQTAVRNSSSTPALTNAVNFKAVYINHATVGGCSITNNVIGGNIAGIPSSVFVLGDATTAAGITARLIDNYVSSLSAPTSIQGNTIANITISSTVSNSFIGIHGRQSAVNIGNISGNTVGSQTGTGSIVMYYNGTSTNINIYAIRLEASSGLVKNNLIGSMSAEARNASGAQQLLAIYANGTLPAPLIITENTVGGTSSHSLQSTVTSVGNCNVMGICASGATGSLLTISNNVVRNLSNLNGSSGTGNAVKGVYLTGASSVGTIVSNNSISKLYSVSTNPSADQASAVLGITNNNTSGTHLISGNIVSDLHADAAVSAVNVTGILLSGTNTSTGNVVERNSIYGLRGNASNNAVSISAINMGTAITTGKYTIANNMVSLGRDTNGLSLTAGQQTTGILKQAGVSVILHNSVSIGGTGVDSSSNNSFAYRSLSNAAGDSVINNIFVNTRTNAINGGGHYAASLASATNITSDYNLFYTSAAPVAIFNGSNQATLSDWKISTGKDASSVSIPVNFISHADLHLTGSSIGQGLLAGTPLTHVSTDYDQAVRSSSFPYMGADENSVPVPVSLLSFTAVKSGDDVTLNWLTASEVNNHYFEVQRSTDNLNFQSIGKVKGKGTTGSMSYYAFDDRDAFAAYKGTLYYRLRQVDFDGTYNWSKVVSVSTKNAGTAVIVHPNPFFTYPALSVPEVPSGTNALITIYNINGKTESKREILLNTGNNSITLEEMEHMKAGVYILSITIGSETSFQRIVKL